MGNVIYLEGQPEHTALSMGNGLTDTLISALLLSGSQLAKTDQEKRLIVWPVSYTHLTLPTKRIV